MRREDGLHDFGAALCAEHAAIDEG